MVRSRRSTPAKRVDDANGHEEASGDASSGVVPGGGTAMESPAGSVVSSPDGSKDAPTRDGDYEAFRFAMRQGQCKQACLSCLCVCDEQEREEQASSKGFQGQAEEDDD